MVKVCVLKKNGDAIYHPIKEDIILAWLILIGLKLPDEATEQVCEMENGYESPNYRGVKRSPIQEWAVFTKLEGKKLVINKRYVAWIEE